MANKLFGRATVIEVAVELMKAAEEPKATIDQFIDMVQRTKGIDDSIEVAACFVNVEDLEDGIRRHRRRP